MSSSVITSESLTVLELFQSQGCSSCPPTNANIINLSTHPGYLVLTYEVTYWDYLGWKDTFGNGVWDKRQWEYARALGSTRVYTPQVIVNGTVDGVGNRPKELQKIIDKGKRTHPLTINTSPDGSEIIIIGSDYHDSASILLVYYVANPEDVMIKRGENRGRTLPHRNVVKDLCEIGTWKGGEMRVALPFREHGLESAVIVQAGRGGAIIGAAKI